MNYYKEQEIEQVIEEPNRQPLPASSHVALTTHRETKPRKDYTPLKAALFGVTAFGFVLLANLIELPTGVLATFAGLCIATFVYVSIKGEKNV